MKPLIMKLFTIAFLYRFFLKLLESRSFFSLVPENVKDVYDAAACEKWRSNKKKNLWRTLFAFAVSYIVDILFLAFDVYAGAAAFFEGNIYSELFGVTLLFELVIFIRTKKYTFPADRMKFFLTALGARVGLTCALAGIHMAVGNGMLLLFTAVLFLYDLLLAFLSPVFLRLFNKFSDLEDGELRRRLISLLEKNGYKVRAIRVMDASRRSDKSNAYFSGFGSMKTIVLYDTLLDTMNIDEICAVFAHEIGHGLHNDTLKKPFFYLFSRSIITCLIWVCLQSPELFTAFGFSCVNYGFAVIIAESVGMVLISPPLGLLNSWYFHRAEYRADAQAVKEGYGPALISALKKLARGNFEDLAPSPLLVKLTYSHPTLSQRIAAIEARR